MTAKKRSRGIIRWLLSASLVFVGLSATWAWGEVARLGEPDPQATRPQEAPLYGIWQPEQAGQPGLYRSADGGQSWELLSLPPGAVPLAWMQQTSASGDEYLAVASNSGALVSTDGGDSWATAIPGLKVLSLAWDTGGTLYLGTDAQGVYHLPAGTSSAIEISAGETGLAKAPVTQLAWAPGTAPEEGRLFAATSTALFSTDDGGRTWRRSAPVEDWISALAVTDPEIVYVGTETTGVYRSIDGGQSWQPAREGLGLAAGQMVKVTALRADPELQGVLYAAIDHVLGSTQTHVSAAGTFLSIDAGGSWQPLAGPAWPEAQHASNLILLPGRPLHVQVVTASGLQAYTPDLPAALAALESPEPASRAAAARLLGLARAEAASEPLLAALTDAEPAVSLAAGRALGQIGDPSTVGPLLVALQHPSLQVRLGAARALGMLGAETAVEPLRASLLEGEGQEVTVAAEALGAIGSPAAVEALLVPLADLTLTPRRHAALASLEALGEPAVEPLVQRLDNPSSHIRRNATQALGWIGAPSATGPLLRALREDRDDETRALASWALGEIRDPAAQAALARAAADDPSPRVRSAAHQALGRMAEQTGVSQNRPAGWLSNWAPTLYRLQPLRWLFLAFSLAGAAWLALGRARLAPLATLSRGTDS